MFGKLAGGLGSKMAGNTGVAGGMKPQGPIGQATGMTGKASGPLGKLAANIGGRMGISKPRSPMGGRSMSGRRY